MPQRAQITVKGIVQGVGFRPFVYQQALQRRLTGRVLNNGTGVLIEVEGDQSDIDGLVTELKSNAPPLSVIDSVEYQVQLGVAGFEDFRILESENSGQKFVPLSVDVSTCADCWRELFDPADRRFHYPFINCTNCGPRFTIIDDVPYDRSRTTMRDFEMCAACRAEYENPLDRRFHAEPIACPACGPKLSLVWSDHKPEGNRQPWQDGDLVETVRRLLASGRIVAIKGIGGFHLACDALDATVVERLRQRKYREDKPFAMMANSLEIIRKHCFVSAREEQLLLSEQRPIVLLERRPESDIPSAVSPGVGTLGFMLPYSPLHYLLLSDCDKPLVMTSANVSDEPISYENKEALQRLAGIADCFLLHDRRIRVRADDSVTRVFAGQEMVLRRSRGYAPAPIKTAIRFNQQILACGAELKNTFCLARDNYAFVSQHIGNLENLETLSSFSASVEHFKRVFYFTPEVVAYDLHPEYLSTKYALALDDQLEKFGVQHHHAHVASCMADNNLDGEVIGVAMDGLGFGLDGRLWGGEFFVADFQTAERVAHLRYVPLPGGEKAIREPWRVAAAYLERAFGRSFTTLDLDFNKRLNKGSWKTISRMIETATNCPETSSMGRLFDAVSSLSGLRDSVNYEGQAAIELEAIAARQITAAYEFAVADSGEINAEVVIRGLVADLLDGQPPSVIAAKFHQAVAHLIANMAVRLRDQYRLNRVVLSGGVFQNMLLLQRATELLNGEGFAVFSHHRVPPNDGGISLGQAVIANARSAAGRV